MVMSSLTGTAAPGLRRHHWRRHLLLLWLGLLLLLFSACTHGPGTPQPGTLTYEGPQMYTLKPGEVLLINAMTPGGPVSTGMLVLYVDDEAFTLMTPEGHPESGWVTFSAYEQDSATVARVQTMARANDPIYEMAFMALGSKLQDSIWVLRSSS